MEKYKKIFLCAIIMNFIFNSFNYADFTKGSGRNTGDFLNIIPDPKITAMGDGSTADMSNSPSGVMLNPAKLFGLECARIGFTQISYPGEIQYRFANFGTPTPYGNVGACIGFLNYSDIQGYEVDSNGAFNKVNIDNCYDLLLQMSYVIPIKTFVPIEREYGALGLNLKFVQSKLADYSAESLALDVGGIFKLPVITGLSAGFSYRNLGSDMKFVKRSYSLPGSFNLGLAYKCKELNNFLTTVDLIFPQNEDFSYTSFGVSVSPLYFLTLRAGLKQQNKGTYKSLLSDVRSGLGLEFGTVKLDYSFTPCEYLNPEHQISVSLAVGNIIGLEDSYSFYLKKHFNEACEYYYKKDYVIARQKFDEILSVYPDHAESKEYLAKIMTSLEQIENKDEKKIEYLLNKAEYYLDKKNFVQAKKYYGYVIAINPDEERARVGIETIWKSLEEIKSIQNREKRHKDIEKLWKKAMNYYVRKDYIKAKNGFREVLIIDPENENAQKYLVEVDNQIKKIAAAQINELYIVAAEYYKAGNYKEAVKHFEAVAIAAPHRLDAQDYIKRCREKIKEIEEKEQTDSLLKQQGRIKGELSNIYNNAVKLYEKGSYETALDGFKRSEALAKQYKMQEYIENTSNYIMMIKVVLAENHYKKGFEYFRKNDFEAASKEYLKALDYNPENVSARVELQRLGKDVSHYYYLQGMTYFSRNEKDKAKEMFKKALLFNPNKAEAQRALERIK